MSAPNNENAALPDDIVSSIAIANANTIGLQPSILANLALANQIFQQNLQQQATIANQRAIDLLALAAIARCVSLLVNDVGTGPKASAELSELITLLKSLRPPEAIVAAK